MNMKNYMKMHTNFLCYEGCGKHRISMWSSDVGAMNMDFLLGCLKKIANSFTGLDLNTHTINFEKTYVTCDMRVVVSTVDVEEIYPDMIRHANTRIYLDNEFCSYYHRLVNRMADLIEYWDICRTKQKDWNEASKKVTDTFTDEWMQSFRNCHNDLDSILDMFKCVSMCEIVDEYLDADEGVAFNTDTDEEWEMVI